MRASSDRLAADVGGVRASDAERDQAIGELRDRFVEGRLSQETFLYRMDAALRAKDHGDLAGLFADLPRTARYPRGSEPAQDWPARARPADARPADGELGLRRLGRLALGRLSSARQAAAPRPSVLPARPTPP